MWFNRRKYVPKVPDFLALCERNYAQLNRFLAADATVGQYSVLHVSEQHQYRITLTDCARFTTTLHIGLEPVSATLSHYFRPSFIVRLYHDAQVAEVIACQHVRHFKARYDYPNVDMLLPDEKRQINLLLRDWLVLCAEQGYVNRELAFG